MILQILDYLATLPIEILICITLFTVFMVDVFYTMWFKYVGKGKKVKAGLSSAMLYLFSFTGIGTVLEINNWLIIAAMVAAFAGTVVTMKVYEIKERKEDNV